MTELTTKKTAKWILGIIITAIVIFILATSQGTYDTLKLMIMPLIYAGAVAYILDAVVRAFQKRAKLTRGKSILITYLLVIFLIILAIVLLVPLIYSSITAIIDILPSTEQEWKDIAQDFVQMVENTGITVSQELIDNINLYLQSISKEIVAYIGNAFSTIQNTLISAVVVTASSIFTAITSLILSIYMLMDKEDLLARFKRLIRAIFSKNVSDYLLRQGSKTNETFIAFFIGKMIDSVFVSLISIVGFSLAGIPFAPLMGIILGVFNMIPYFGPIFATVPIVIISLIAGGWTKGVLSLVIILVLQQFDANYMDPKIVGQHVGTRPFWIIFAVTAGGAAFGAIGMITAVPIMIVTKEAIEEFVEDRLREKGEAEYLIADLKEAPKKIVKDKSKKKK